MGNLDTYGYSTQTIMNPVRGREWTKHGALMDPVKGYLWIYLYYVDAYG